MTFGVGGGGGSVPVSGIADVALNNVANGEVLTYQTSTATWQNQAVPVSTGSDNGIVEASTVTGNYTLVQGDAGKIKEVNSSSPVTITVPSGLTLNSVFEVVQVGTGQVTIAGAGGVVLQSPASLKTRVRYSSVAIRKRAAGGASGIPTGSLLARWRADDLTGANGSAVSSWPESSGNGLPAATQATTANQPTLNTTGLNGHKTVVFDGATNDFLSLSGTALDIFRNRSAANVFIAYTTGSSFSGARTLLAFSSGTSTTQARAIVQRDSTGTLAVGGRRADTDSGVFVSGAPISTSETGVATGRFVYSATSLYNYKNGSLNGSNTSFQTAGSTSNTASLSASIGANTAGTADWWVGGIAEILIYGADLATNERAQVHSYFQDTYGISVADYAASGDQFHVTGDLE